MGRRTTSTTSGLSNGALRRVAAFVALGMISLAGLAPACSSSDETGSPCETKYKGKCDLVCSTDTDCAAGLYCGTTGKCTADCSASGEICGPQLSCTSRGRCVQGSLFGGGGDNGLGSTTDGGSCVVDKRRGEGLAADIYIMNDQSQSMGCAVPGGTNRWNAMKGALTSFVNSPNAAGLGVGIQYFGLGRDNNGQGSCDPNVYTPADVEIAALPGNSQAIVQSLNRHRPSTYTPTPAAIDGAIAHAKKWATDHPDRITTLVLATDGQPNLCGNAADRIGSVANSAQAAFNGTPQIRTYVIGIIGGSAANGGQGCDVDPAPPNKPDLDRVAKAGGTDQALIVDAANGDTSAQFLDALNRIRGAAVVPCQYVLPASEPGREIDPHRIDVAYTPPGGTAANLVESFDEASCAATGGWYFDNNDAPTKILLCPTTCNAVKSDAKAGIDVIIGCKVNPIPTR